MIGIVKKQLKLIIGIGILLIPSFIAFSQEKSFSPDEIIYKQVDTVKLKMLIYKPEHLVDNTQYPAIVFFFGGGWKQGNILQFQDFARHYASKGMITILADYRVEQRQGTTPFEALKDAKSAMRYVRENAGKLHIDPGKIVASGGSAGGHLAAACFTNKYINEETDNIHISPEPNALVLFNPVIDNSKAGYGYDRVGERYIDFSPLHNIRKDFPPTIFFLGTKDDLIPVTTAQAFKQKIEAVGGYCNLFLYENQKHGFFNQKIFHEDILCKTDTFLKSIGFL